LVELVEYIVVFGVTVSLSAFSILIVGGSIPVISQSQGRAQFEEILGAASLGALRGNSTLVMTLSGASLSCSQGELHVSTSGSSYSSQVNFPCGFNYSAVSCLCTLVFTRVQGTLQLQVQS
jgi:hypothetical protein